MKDQCPSCDSTHIDLSQPAFAKLAPLDKGVISGLTWQFVKAGLNGRTVELSEPVTGSTIG
ncbi:RlpA-like double-psi beta-barrel domain-containing protein [Kitasatospora sp. NPDC059160]|uniref:RlpA-like double-psi beta-barrel domain-containing protein n=1 Tax=Kitasatospora sp. NPDC059160 TaxID=3346748 RepID=UPI0036769ECB